MICDATRDCFFALFEDNLKVKCSKKESCLEFCDQRQKANCRENNKVYALENTPSTEYKYKIMSIHIDGGVVVQDADTSPNIEKCDYLFFVETSKMPIAILIELKGKDINHAINQIEKTLELFKDVWLRCGKVYGRIVYGGGTPNLQNTPAFMRLQRQLKKKSGNLQAKTNIFPEKCSDLI